MKAKTKQKKSLPSSKVIKDLDIRKSFLLQNEDFFKDKFFVNEFGINSTNIVDFSAFDFKNNIYYGFEIKSGRDNLKRLRKQLIAYVSFFHIVYVITHEKHLAGVIKLINSIDILSNVGVIVVTDGLKYQEVKQARMNYPRFSKIVENLEIDEVHYLCESKGVKTNRNKKELISVLKKFITMDDIYKGLEYKIKKFHSYTCPKCGGHLYHNKRYGYAVESRCFRCD